MIRVWHLNIDRADRETRLDAQTGFRPDEQIAAVRKLWDAGAYGVVAEIDTTDRRRAWAMTNNVESSWSMEPGEGVAVLAPLHNVNGKTYGLRSTMVGDIMEMADGTFFVVASFGYEKIELSARTA